MMLSRNLMLKCLRTHTNIQRLFFYDTNSLREDLEDKKGVRDYLRDDYLKTRLREHFKHENASLDNVLITEIASLFKAVSTKEDIDLATKIFTSSFSDSHYQMTNRYSSEVANRYFVLCLNNNLPDHATQAWKLLEDSSREKGKNLILRFRQLLFNSGRFRDLIDLTLNKEELNDPPNRRNWRNHWFYMGSLYEIGDEEAFDEASQWYWKVWEPVVMRDDKKISVLAVHWLFSLLALKNRAYAPAYHACLHIKDPICYQILLTVLIETQRLEDAVDFLKDEVDNIKVIGTDIVRTLTTSVKEGENSELHNELIKVCGELDSKVRLEERPISEQVYDAMKNAEKRN